MDKKEFEFHGFDFKRAMIGGIAALIIGVLGAVAVGFLIWINHPGFYFCISALIVFTFGLFYGNCCKGLWRITLVGKTARVSFDGKLRSEFKLSELRKIHINGWFKANSAAGNQNSLETNDEHRPQIVIPMSENYFLFYLRSRGAIKAAYRRLKNKDTKGSYRWLRLTTEDDKFMILIGGTTLINTADRRDLAAFDSFVLILEAYAIKNKFEKTDMKKSYNPAFVRHYYYLKK